MRHPRRAARWIPWMLAGALSLPAAVIKVGSVAPSRSPWDKALNELAVEWEKITGGAVQLKIFAGGIVGSELDMIRKMRLGTIGAAVLTNMGIIKIDPDVFVLNTPFLMDSDDEFNYVFDRMKLQFEKQIEAKGFKVVLWTMAGWVRLFTKERVLFPEELKKFKISFTTGEPELEQAWKKMGYQIVPNNLNDMMMALQSGMVNAYYLPPLIAGSGQYFALTPHMLDLNLSPLVGGLVFTNRSWQAIPAQYHEPMVRAIERIASGLYQRTQQLERDALKTMQENGLKIEQAPADALGRWRQATEHGMDELVGKAFSKEIYDQIKSIIQQYRQSRGK